MNTIARHYYKIYTAKYQLHGFSRSKSTFLRIRGDVIQAFSLKISSGMPICTIDFGIYPLCLPQPVFFDSGGYDLNDFFAAQHENSIGWTFDTGSEKSMISCIESIFQATELYLLPFMEACSDCESSLAELIKLEKLFDSHRKQRLCLRGDSDCAISWQQRSLFDSRKYYMALKAHNLSYAQQYLQYQVEFCKDKINAFDNSDYPRQPNVVKERFREKLVLCTEQLHLLNSGDFSYFDDLLGFNETQMLKLLTASHPTINCYN